MLFTSFNSKMTVCKKIRVQDVRKGERHSSLFLPLYDDDDVTQSNATFIKEIIEKKRNKKSSKTRRHLFFDLSLRAL